MVYQHKRVYLDHSGLELFVGPTEAMLLIALWDQAEPITMSKLYRMLIEQFKTEAAYSTIITTLNRMANKKMIVRQDRDGKTPLWSSAFVNEDHFIEECMIATLNVLRDNYSEQFSGYIGV